jgi:hypothetical protein
LRRFTTWAIVLLVLVGLLVAADRISAYAASRAVADQVRNQLAAEHISTSTPPSVQLGGFPFLTQVIRGHYDHVTIDVKGASTQGVTFSDLHITATGVHAKTSQLIRGSGPIAADQVAGTARLTWSQVPTLLEKARLARSGAQISGSDDGQVTIRQPIQLGGSTTTLVATGTVTAANGKVAVKINHVTTEGASLPPLLQELIGPYAQQLSGSFALPTLPYHLKLTGVAVSAAALTIRATGQSVLITAGSAA